MLLYTYVSLNPTQSHKLIAQIKTECFKCSSASDKTNCTTSLVLKVNFVTNRPTKCAMSFKTDKSNLNAANQLINWEVKSFIARLQENI